MRTAASRLPKGFSLDERLSACSSNYEPAPKKHAGKWRNWFAPGAEGRSIEPNAADAPGFSAQKNQNAATSCAQQAEPYEAVVLDLGCGKGEYTVAVAAEHPNVLFVGLDVDGVCVMRAAERAIVQGVSNAVFAIHDDSPLDETFGAGELSALLLNFPTPFPKKKKAALRLTHFERLMAYRPLLAEGAAVRLRTDSQPLRDFSLTQLEIAGYQLQWQSDDVRALFPAEPWSGYERKLTQQGAPVLGFAATPGPAPENPQQTAPLSLVSYLPENIEELTYVPHGMQGCVDNMKGRRANRRAKGLPEWQRPVI